MIKGRIDRQTYAETLITRRRKPTKSERRVIFDRLAKKYLRHQGLIGPKIPSTWFWTMNEKVGGKVIGFCKSDARGEIKRILGLGKNVRLPATVIIEKDR